MAKNLLLFTPGPVMTSSELKSSLGHYDMPHRRPCFEEVLTRVQKSLLNLFNANNEYSVSIVSGSGTAANETALSSIIRDSDEVLLLKNGMFGDRLGEILACYKYKVHIIESEWGQPFDISSLEKMLQSNSRITWVCMVYHETSTGMINPVKQIGELLSRYRRQLFVDCISAIGGEPIDVIREHIDVCTGSGNKAIASTTGISFVCAKRSVIPKLGVDVPRRNIYLNLQNHIEWADKKAQTPNTPAVTMFIALDTSLKELFLEGTHNRFHRHQECTSIIRHGLRRLGLKLLLPDELNSNTVTSAFLPKGIDISDFIDELEQRGYVIYPGKGPLFELNLIQIATMGWIYPKDCRNLLRALEETIQFLSTKR